MVPSLREIRLFVAVYEEQSFTAAAVREHATQSGVSQHIKNLEERLGVQLLDRQKGVRPTPAGTAYYLRCLEVLKAHALARRTLDEFSAGLSGEVVVGLMPTMTRSIVAPTVQSFSTRHPNVRVRVVEAYSAVLTNALRAGELDFAIVPRASDAATGIRSTLFAQTREFLVSAPGGPLTHGEPVRLSELQDLRLVLPGAANARRPMLEQYFATHGVTVAARLEFDTMLGTLDLVARSDWRAVLPGVFVSRDIASGAFTLNPLANPPLLLDLMLIEPERQPLSAAASAFLDALREVTDEANRLATAMADHRA
jgi:LysR family nitrogen assimilation transcriptional regulator